MTPPVKKPALPKPGKPAIIHEMAPTAISRAAGAPIGDKLLMIGGLLFVACLFAHHVLGIGKETPGENDRL